MTKASNATLAAGIVVVSATLIYTYIRSKKSRVEITLPKWLIKYENTLKDKIFTTDEEMMEVAVEISARNVAEETGGPFGCAIFERDTNTQQTKIFAVGCNRVTPLNNSTVHGEMCALQFAEKKLNSFSLKKADNIEYIMCTSCEPCCMCLGGTLWAGPAEMHCAATKADAEEIGFDEGPVYPDSYKHMEASGIKVKREILRSKARQVLKDFAKTEHIY